MDIQILLLFPAVFIIVLIGFLAFQRESLKERKVEEEIAKEKKWKEFLSGRSETIIDGVFGLVLGLSAYSLTGFTIGRIEDIELAVSYFTLTFFLVCLFWWSVAKWFAIAEYSDALMSINFFFILLLVLMPFFLRLLVIPEPAIKNIGIALFPLDMGALLLGGFLANVVILRQRRDMPGEALRDLKRGLFSFPIMAAGFFFSVLIPAEATTETYFPQLRSLLVGALKDLPFRFLFWWFTLVLGLIIGGLTEFLQERRVSKSKERESSWKEWRETLTRKCRTMNDAVYGLALGLCAFSLTDYALRETGDIILAVSYFLLTFFLIFMFWGELFRCFALVPFFDDSLVRINLLLTFFVALMPFSLRLAMVSDIGVRNIGMAFFPMNMMAAGLSSSVFIALALRRRTVDIPKDDLMELQRFVIFSPALAVIYIASLWIPPDAPIPLQLVFIPDPLKTLPFRVLVWWLSLIPVSMVLGIVEIIHEKMARRS